MKYKRCTKCKRHKLTTTKNFAKDKIAKDGLHHRCKICDRRCSAKWRRIQRKHRMAYGLVYRREHRKEARDRAKEYRKEIKLIVINHYGGKCQCPGCKEHHIEFLTIDHIKGGGKKHRKHINTNCGTQFYIWLIRHKFPKGFQVLCYNCNCGKNANGGVCPHKYFRGFNR